MDNTGSDDISDLGFPIWVVSSVTEDNGISGSYRTSNTYNYEYSNGLYDYEEREFRGFANVKVTDPNGDYKGYKFHQDDARKGQLNGSSSNDKYNNAYDEITNTWEYSAKPEGYYEFFWLFAIPCG